jgi:outer membrane protein TolC
MDPRDSSFWQVHLDPIEDPAASSPLPDLDAVVARALNERYDLARVRNEMSNAATNVDFFSNQKLPDVRLETSYSGTGLGGSQLLRTGGFPGVVTGRLDSGFADVLSQMFGRDYPTWSVGVTVSYPLGRSFEAMSAVRAEVERRQAAQRLASLQLDVAETLRQAARQVRSATEREEAARAGAALAAQRFEAEERRYGVGLSTTFLVTQAQRDLLQAQVNLVQATLDRQSSFVNFEALQLAPPLATGAAITLSGSDVVVLPPPSPRGAFRPGTVGGLQP